MSDDGFTRLRARARGAEFRYRRGADGGVEIRYGRGGVFRAVVTRQQLGDLCGAFTGRRVRLGTSRDNPPEDSVGAWLKKNVSKTALASYVGPVLVEEGLARWTAEGELQVV